MPLNNLARINRPNIWERYIRGKHLEEIFQSAKDTTDKVLGLQAQLKIVAEFNYLRNSMGGILISKY